MHTNEDLGRCMWGEPHTHSGQMLARLYQSMGDLKEEPMSKAMMFMSPEFFSPSAVSVFCEHKA